MSLLGGGSSATWVWRGQDWREVDKSGPPGGAGGHVFFDNHAQRLRYVSRKFEEWEWHGHEWTSLRIMGRPQVEPTLFGPKFALDPRSGSVVAIVSDPVAGVPAATWLLSGDTWRKAERAPVDDGVLVASGEEDRLLLFGSAGGTPPPAPHVWQWTADRWVQLPAEPGGVRLLGGGPVSGAYDPVGRRYVVQAGDDVQEFRDGRWSSLLGAGSPCTGSGDDCAGVVYSPQAGAVLAFQPGEWWELSGRSWIKRPTSVGPRVTFAHLAYDPSTQNVVLFGGCDHGGLDTQVCQGPG
ncbi:MAG: large repetitive protein [Chloroflexota bacterium]|jgi:hypothetical protein|nr:large repetitive protein [Chloroflexota bacterium]